VSKPKIILFVGTPALLILGAVIWLSLLVANPQVANAANCTSPCKVYVQWSGGTSGGQEEIEPNPIPTCNLVDGCNWVQKGMWVKLNSTGNYIFLGAQRDSSGYKYMLDVYKPASGIARTYIDNVDGGDPHAALFVYSNNGYQQVTLSSDYVGYGPEPTSITDSLWDVVQTGTRLSASGSDAIYGAYHTTKHMWRCQSCGNTWVYQTNNGSELVQGSPSGMVDYWQVQPSQSGSNGGTYYAYCTLCP
jgi:hypothetical protein